MTEEYGLSGKNIVCVTDSARNMILACRLIGNKRVPCISHKANTLVQTDLMTHETAEPIRKLLKKVRDGQNKLIYRHGELQKFRDEDNQKKFALLMTELSELQEEFDAEMQFPNNSEDEPIIDFAQNDFTGTKTFNHIRWNCIWKFSKFYLDNQSK